MNRSAKPWVVVLAGGDSRRLEGACIQGRRLDRPKQFCCFGGSDSLLGRTLQRAESVTTPEQILTLVRDDHRHWWREELRHLPAATIVTEPENRGTAVAILDALVHVLLRDENPTLVVLPSDHSADDEEALAESIRRAVEWAAGNPGSLLLLGMKPDNADSQYGWILPGDDAGHVRSVARFVEKPHEDLAIELFRAGGLWNSLICAGSGDVLLGLFERIQPDLLYRYLEFFVAHEANDPEWKDAFHSLPHVDFCRDMLEAATHLRVLPVPPCGWTDLGTPPRVEQWLRRRGAGVQAGERHPVAA